MADCDIGLTLISLTGHGLIGNNRSLGLILIKKQIVKNNSAHKVIFQLLYCKKY